MPRTWNTSEAMGFASVSKRVGGPATPVKVHSSGCPSCVSLPEAFVLRILTGSDEARVFSSCFLRCLLLINWYSKCLFREKKIEGRMWEKERIYITTLETDT
jgi:hypothetical protein